MTEVAGIEYYHDSGENHPYWGDRNFSGSSAVPTYSRHSERNYMSSAKRAKREELEEYSILSEKAAEAAPAPKAPLGERMTKAVKSPYFFGDLAFNIMNYVLVPASAVALFVLYVYAETMRSMGQ